MAETTIHGIEFQIKGNADDASKALDKLANTLSRVKKITSGGLGLKSISNTLGKIKGSAIGKLFSYPFAKSLKSLGEYRKKLDGVLGGFKRIVGYRLIRTIIKEIAQAFKDGTNNLYAWSNGIGGKFAANMNDAATSMLYFKNSVGAAWSPLMNVLAPALRAVTDAAVELLNVINQLLARLTGQSSWTRARRAATEYGDAVGGAGQAAKEAMRYLAPFDELNVLPDNKDSGGGGGGGTSASEMFEEVSTFEDGIADFADKVREAINSQNWIGLGTLLGEKINEIVDSVNWEGYGQKVGGFINAWFTTRYWTLETVNFQNIGAKIATFFNNAIDEIDFNVIGRSITQNFTIIGDFIIGAVENINWHLVGESIRDFIVGAFNQLSQWADDIDWGNFGTELYNSVKNLIEGLDFSGIARSFFTLLGSAFGAVSSFGISIVENIVSDVVGYFSSFENEDDEFTGIGDKWATLIFRGLSNAFFNVVDWIKTNIITPFVNAFKRAIGISGSSGSGTGGGETGDIYEVGEVIGNKILQGLAAPFVNIWQWFLDHVINPLKEKIAGRPLTDFLFGDSEAESPTGNDGGGTFLGGGWSVDVEANVVSVKDSVPWESKVSAHWTADIETGKDEIIPEDKNLEGFEAYVYDFVDYVDANDKSLQGIMGILNKQKDEVKPKDKLLRDEEAVFGSVDTSELTTKQRQIDNMTAGFNNRVKTSGFKNTLGEMIAGFSGRVKTSGFNSTLGEMVAGFKGRVKSSGFNSTLGEMVANFTSRKSSLKLSDVTWRSLANFTSAEKRNLTEQDKTWRTTADFRYAEKTNLTDAQKTWQTTANFKWRNDSLSEDQKTFGTTSRFQWMVDWLSGNDKTFGSTARFDYGSDNLSYYDRILDAYASFIDSNGWKNYVPTEWLYVLGAWNGWYGGTPTTTVRAQAVWTASGGAYYGGAWHDIPQYASGGKPPKHGSLYIAGEQGPELVGHIGGRTEVLNRSQLASTMYSAVSNAMAGLRFNISGMNVANYEDGGYDEDMIYRAMLRALNDSDSNDRPIELDGDVLYRKMVQRNQMNTRMTGRNVLATA